MPNLGRWWWIILFGGLLAAALFVAMQFTLVEMQEAGQPSPEHLQQESGDDPGEQ
jgi:hypothetical protein